MTSTPAEAVLKLARDGTAARLAALTPPARELHRAVLRAFLDTGRAPGRTDLEAPAGRLGLDLDRALAQLAAADMVHADDAGDVVVAYPFSAHPTGHTVRLGEVTVNAMCAIDALGIPQMTGRDTVITAADPATGQPVEVRSLGGRWSWEPASTVVLVAAARERGTSAECSCPLVNFYVDAETAEAELRNHPELSGQVLDQADAVEVARLCFGSLLDG